MTLPQEICQPVPSAERDEHEYLWRTAVHDRLTSIDLRPTGRFPRIGSAVEHDLGDLLVTDWDCPDFEGTRSSRMIGRDTDALLIFTVLDGCQMITTPDQTVIQRPGGILIMCTRTTAKVVVPESVRMRSVRIPLTALSPFDMGHSVPNCLLLDIAQHPLANLAHDFLPPVDRDLRRMSPAEVECARNALLVLIAGMIRASRAPAASDAEFMPALRDRLEAWIVDRLAFGAIKVRELAAAHNVAPRTVHRAFAATGDTLGSVVRAHRLAAARSDLVNTTSPIATIAHRCGFCDASHLGREFRREFSMSPGGYREAYSIGRPPMTQHGTHMPVPDATAQ